VIEPSAMEPTDGVAQVPSPRKKALTFEVVGAGTAPAVPDVLVEA